jgi:hypothetical protein
MPRKLNFDLNQVALPNSTLVAAEEWDHHALQPNGGLHAYCSHPSWLWSLGITAIALAADDPLIKQAQDLFQLIPEH